jgi:hypothetical protein
LSFKLATAIAVSMLAFGALPGYADSTTDTIDKYVTFSGFGTLGVVHSDYDLATFRGPADQPDGAGYGHSWSPTPDSDLGLQANFTLTDKLSGVVQILSRDDVDGDYNPEVEWANLKYDITSDLAVRLGRMILPTYEKSETQNVGYALPWVRVPSEISYTSTATHNDGIDVLYRVTTGAITQNLQVQWGTTTEDLPGTAFISNRATVVNISDTLQYGNSSMHLVYQKWDPSGFPPARLRLLGLGFTYDPGSWFVTGDSNHTQDAFFGDFFAWYVSGGVRLGRFAPYATYSSTRAQSVGTSELKALGDQHTVAAGVRWDFAKNLDTKLQVEQVTIDTLNDPVGFTNLQPGVHVGDKAHVLSWVLDFVF